MLARALGGKKQLITKGHEGTFWGNRIILCIDCSGDFITSQIFQNAQICVPKKGELTVYKLNHNKSGLKNSK